MKGCHLTYKGKRYKNAEDLAKVLDFASIATEYTVAKQAGVKNGLVKSIDSLLPESFADIRQKATNYRETLLRAMQTVEGMEKALEGISAEEMKAMGVKRELTPIQDSRVLEVFGGEKASEDAVRQQTAEFTGKDGKRYYLWRQIGGITVYDAEKFDAALSAPAETSGAEDWGFVGTLSNKKETGTKSAYVRVMPEHRRVGIGTAMVQFEEEFTGEPVDIPSTKYAGEEESTLDPFIKAKNPTPRSVAEAYHRDITQNRESDIVRGVNDALGIASVKVKEGKKHVTFRKQGTTQVDVGKRPKNGAEVGGTHPEGSEAARAGTQGAQTKEGEEIKHDRKSARRLRREDQQPAADAQPILEQGETSPSGDRVAGAMGKKPKEIFYQGKKYQVKSQTVNTVTIEKDGAEITIHKDKALAPVSREKAKKIIAPPIEGEKLLGDTDVNAIDNTALGDLVYDTARDLNIELSDDETLVISAYLKKEIFKRRENRKAKLGDVMKDFLNAFTDGRDKRVIMLENKINKKAKGSGVSTPHDSYNNSIRNNHQDKGGNLWVRDSETSNNDDRVLMVQFSSTLLYGKTEFNKLAIWDKFYDKIYRLIKGYDRMSDFWEVPLWMARMAGMEANADVYVIRDMAEAKEFLRQAKYGRVAFSALDLNEAKIVDIIKSMPDQKFAVGGYTKFDNIQALPNAAIYSSMEDYAKQYGVKDNGSYSYKHFKGSRIIPRLKMSDGCRYKCAFCSVPKKIEVVSDDIIMQQIEAIKDLDARLVYLDDKTFGQAPNYTLLAEIYKKIKEYNPDFEGFIIQTTALDFNGKKFSPEFLRESGIRYVELGVESYNDDILTALNKKHSHKKYVDAAMQHARENGIKVIPNLIVGMDGETKATYERSLQFLKDNNDVISHINIYNLAVYEGTPLADAIEAKTDADRNENVSEKSWQKNPKLHKRAMDRFTRYAYGQLDKHDSEMDIEASVSVAPLFKTSVETIKDAVEKRKQPFYDKYIRSLKDLATDMGVIIVDIYHAIGAYDGTTELSNAVYVRGKWEDVVKFAAISGALAPQVQESTIAVRKVPKKSKEHNADLVVVTVSDPQLAMDALEDAGFKDSGYTIVDDDTFLFRIHRQENKDVFREKMIIFAGKLKEYGGEIRNSKKEDIHSEYISEGGRREILAGIREDAKHRSAKGRTSLDIALPIAERRNEEFIAWKAARDLEEQKASENKRIEDEARDLQDALGLQEDDDGSFRLIEEGTETTYDTEDIVDMLNEFSSDQLEFQGTPVSQAQKRNPLRETESLAEITDEEAQTMGFPDAASIVKRLEEFEGIPFLVSISDILASGEVADSQGKPMPVHGGVLFNLVKKFRNFAWAFTSDFKAHDAFNSAKKLYKNHKLLFEDLWAQGKLPHGHIPIGIIKTPNTGVNSNEAVLRWILPTILKQTKKNQRAAMDALKERLEIRRGYSVEKVGNDAKRLLEYIEQKNIKTLGDFIQVLMAEKDETYHRKESISLVGRRAIVAEIFSKAAGESVTRKIIKQLFGGNLSDPDTKKFVLSTLHKAIGERSMMHTKDGSLVSVVGVDVLHGGVEKIDHENYKYGVKGRLIALISNPRHVIDLFAEMRAKASRVFKYAKADMAAIKKLVVGNFANDLVFKGARLRANAISDLDLLVGKLRFAFPSVQVATTQEEFNQFMKDAVRKRVKDGVTIAGVTKDGKIYLNPSVRSLRTPIHEFGHIWIDYLRSSFSGEAGTKLLEQGLKLVDGTQAYKNALEKYGNKEEALEEAVVELMAAKGEGLIEAAKSKFVSWMNAVFAFIQKHFVGTHKLFNDVNVAQRIEAMTLDDFINTGLADLFAGTQVDRKFDPSEAVNAVRERFSIQKLTINEIVSWGRSEGYTDAAIKEVLKARGFGARDVRLAMHISADLFNALPAAFGNVRGGVVEGMKIFENVKAQLQSFLDANSGVSRGIAREKVIEILKGDKVFAAQNLDVQESLIVALDKLIGIKANKNFKREVDAIKNNIAQRKLGASQLREAQIAINSLIRSTLSMGGAYSLREVNKLVSIINNATVDSFNADAEKVLAVLLQQREKVKRAIIKKLAEIVKKKSKPSITSTGKRRAGGVDARTHTFFVQAQRVLSAVLSGDAVNIAAIRDEINNTDRADEILAKEARGETLTTHEERFIDTVLAFDLFAGLLNMELEEAYGVYETIREKRHEGILALQASRLARAVAAEQVNEKVKAQIKKACPILYDVNGEIKNKNQLAQDRHAIWKAFDQLKIWYALKEWASSLNLASAAGVMQWVTKNMAHLGTLCVILDKKGTFFYDNVYTPLNDMSEVSLRGYYEQKTKLNKIANSIDGITHGFKQITRLINKRARVYFEMGGREVTYTKDQLLRIYALYKNDVQREKLQDKDGFTPEAMKKVEALLGKQLTEFADKIVDYFSTDYFEGINSVYRACNDVSLGYVSNYFPTRTLSKSLTKSVLEEGHFEGVFTAETAPALKERTDKTSPVDTEVNFLNVLEDHIASMERYKAYAVGVKKINSIFNSQDVEMYLDQTKMGKVVKYAVSRAINPMRTPNIGFGRAMNKFTSWALALKIVQIPKQASSFINAFEDYRFFGRVNVPILDQVMFLVDTAYLILTLPKQVVKAYNMSASFKERVDSALEGQIGTLETGIKYHIPLSKKTGLIPEARKIFRAVLASPTMIGDLLGCMGYMINYNRDRRNGMEAEEALRKFNDYNSTQQTRRETEKIPLQQTGNGLTRAFTMFASTNILYMNKVVQATVKIMRSIGDGKMPRTKDMRSLVINLGLSNALFVMVSNLPKLVRGDDDDRDDVITLMKRALLGVNILSQVPLIGAVVEEMIAYANDERAFADDIVNPFRNIYRKVIKGVKDEDILKALKPIVEYAAGFQFDPFIGLYNLVADDEDTENDLYMLLGIAPSYRPSGSAQKKNRTYKDVFGMTKKEMKENLPELYDELFGEGSVLDEANKARKAALEEAGVSE